MLHDLTKLKITKDKTLGYEVVYYPKHPFARKGSGVVYLHRIIMENHLGRYLKQDEHVHHKDENRSNMATWILLPEKKAKNSAKIDNILL